MNKIHNNWKLFLESHTKEHEEELEEIVGELEKASQMHASQAKRIQKMLDETDDDKLKEGEGKNCGCGQDPCRTYGAPAAKVVKITKISEEENDDLYGEIEEEVEELDEKSSKSAKRKRKKKRTKKKAKKGNKICPKGKAWAMRKYGKWSAYAAMGASKYCKDPNYGKGKKKNESLDEGGELKAWRDENWVQSDGTPCGDAKAQKNPKRCKPAGKWASMSKGEKKADNAKKKAGGKKGKQFVPATKKGKVKTKENLELDAIIREELEAVLDEKRKKKKKKKKACKPSKGKRFAKRVNGKCRSYGQKGQAKGGGDRIRPGTKKGDAYCARSAKIKKCKNPPCANALSRKKWKCRGSKSMKE